MVDWFKKARPDWTVSVEFNRVEETIHGSRQVRDGGAGRQGGDW